MATGFHFSRDIRAGHSPLVQCRVFLSEERDPGNGGSRTETLQEIQLQGILTDGQHCGILLVL